jgi:hypothetical protein
MHARLLAAALLSLGCGAAHPALSAEPQNDGADERAPLPPLEDLGPRLPESPDEVKLVAFLPGPSSDTVTLKSGETGFTLENAFVQASARTAFICYQNGGPYRGTTIRNSLLKVVPETLPDDRSYWALRGYDMIDTTLERVAITGFGVLTRHHDEGHAIYLNLAGALSIEGSDIHHNGGQGLQLVNRPGESVLPAGPAAGTITVRRTAFRENGFNPDRGAFQVSIFGTGQAVVLEDVAITAGLDGTEYPGGRSGGALLIEAEAWEGRADHPVWWRPAEPPEGWEPPFAQRRTELVRVRIRHASPNRPIVQIKGCEELVVRDCDFGSGRIELDLPGKPGRDCGRIEWSGNRGDAEVWHRGKHLGPAREDFTIEP